MEKRNRVLMSPGLAWLSYELLSQGISKSAIVVFFVLPSKTLYFFQLLKECVTINSFASC